MHKIVLLIPLLLAACHIHKTQAGSFCKDLPAGQYCSKSLNGYYNCNGRSSRGILYKCRCSNQCICHLNKKYNDPLEKSTLIMEQAKEEKEEEEDGNRVLKPLGQTLRREDKDGSSYKLNWIFYCFKFTDDFFVIPKHCKNL